MPIRMVDTEIWEEDWFLQLGGEYMLLYKYITDSCDNAGIWRVNSIKFELLSRCKISLDSFLKKVNGDRERVVMLKNGRWFLPGFIRFQHFRKSKTFILNPNNTFHFAMIESLYQNEVSLIKVWGLRGIGDYPLSEVNSKILASIIDQKRNKFKGASKGASEGATKAPTKGAKYMYKHKDNSFKSTNEISKDNKYSKPKLKEVEEFFIAEGQSKKLADLYFNFYEARDWETAGEHPHPIAYWRPHARTWIIKQRQYDHNGISNSQALKIWEPGELNDHIKRKAKGDSRLYNDLWQEYVAVKLPRSPESKMFVTKQQQELNNLEVWPVGCKDEKEQAAVDRQVEKQNEVAEAKRFEREQWDRYRDLEESCTAAEREKLRTALSSKNYFESESLFIEIENRVNQEA